MSREYKDSGIEWIGQIPKEWELPRLKNVAELHGRIGWNGLRSEEFEEQSYAYLVTGQDFVSSEINWNKCYQIRKERYDEDEFIQLKEGELLVTKDGTIGKVAVVSNMAKPACLNSGIFVLRQKVNSFFPKFLYWQLYSSLLKMYNDYMNMGGTTIIHLYQNVFERMPLILPPFYEQQKIADYLDKICGEADEMIALQEKMIEELKAYKQSVITEAVTKGLNPNVPMKDSGIDWIGEIPEHWKKITLKHIITKIESGVSVNAELIQAENDEFGVLKTSSVSSNYFIPSENKRVDIEEYNRVSCPVKADTIIVSRMNTPELVGAAGYCSQDIPTIFLPDRLWQVHFDKSKLFVKFGWYYLISSPIKAYYSSLSSGTSSSMQNISQPQFCKAFFLLPPIPEQQSIASYLESKCSDIDALIAVKQQKIEELKSYKKSIIYEYVTGKKEVV